MPKLRPEDEKSWMRSAKPPAEHARIEKLGTKLLSICATSIWNGTRCRSGAFDQRFLKEPLIYSGRITRTTAEI